MTSATFYKLDESEMPEGGIGTLIALGADDHPVIVAWNDESLIYIISNGLLIRSECDRWGMSTKVITAQEYYEELLEAFETLRYHNELDPVSYMREDFNAPDGRCVFGNADFYVAWKADAGYQVNKGVIFDEPAMIVGSSRIPAPGDRKFSYTKNGYGTANEDYFDVGITESGKFFAVQKGEVKYFNPVEFQKFLEEALQD